jgi:hypothetical protein
VLLFELPMLKSIEFEKVSVEEARLVLHGVPAKPGAIKGVDKRTRIREEPLLNVTRAWLGTLPREARPTELARQSPRIANRLRHFWNQVAKCEEYLNALLFDSRGTRQGFPQNIVKELETLRQHHALLHPHRRSNWDAVSQGASLPIH